MNGEDDYKREFSNWFSSVRSGPSRVPLNYKPIIKPKVGKEMILMRHKIKNCYNDKIVYSIISQT